VFVLIKHPFFCVRLSHSTQAHPAASGPARPTGTPGYTSDQINVTTLPQKIIAIFLFWRLIFAGQDLY